MVAVVDNELLMLFSDVVAGLKYTADNIKVPYGCVGGIYRYGDKRNIIY